MWVYFQHFYNPEMSGNDFLLILYCECEPYVQYPQFCAKIQALSRQYMHLFIQDLYLYIITSNYITMLINIYSDLYTQYIPDYFLFGPPLYMCVYINIIFAAGKQQQCHLLDILKSMIHAVKISSFLFEMPHML